MTFESKDLLINIDRLPPRGSSEFKPFWKLERDKCKYGVTIDGVYIPGFLYWHLNIYKTMIDIDEGGGRTIRKMSAPYLRDNEWFLGMKIHEADTFKLPDGRYSKKGICALGTRRFAKTLFQSSWIRYNSTLYPGTQNVIAGGNDKDIKIIADEIDRFDSYLLGGGVGQRHPFAQNRIEANWKSQITYGKKDAQGNKFPYSYIPVRNFDEGNNTEAIAGLTPQSIVLDEIGKYPFLEGLKAALPGLETDFGWRCVVFAMGTGGDMDNYHDAMELFDNPDRYNFLACDVPEENRKCGIYLPGWMSYRKEFPKQTEKLTTYLQLEPKDFPNLAKIDIKVSTKEKAIEEIKKIRISKEEDPKEKMYYPLNTRDIFLTIANNNFPIPEIAIHQQYLKDNYEPDLVDLVRNADGTIKAVASEKKLITKFPVGMNDNKDAAVAIAEHPIEGVPDFTYVGGIDAYDDNESSARVNSLGSIYIYKRTNDPTKPFQNSIVAWYSGRPKTTREFADICTKLLQYYGAVALLERNKSFVEILFGKKKDYLLVSSLPIAKAINPNSMAQSEKGLAPTVDNIKYYMNLEVVYTKDELDPDSPKLGCTRIPDVMLLEEMKLYRATQKGGHDINVDRIVAFGHALILAQILDRDASLIETTGEREISGFNLSGAFNRFIRPNVRPSIDPFTGAKVNSIRQGKMIPKRNPFL